MSDERKRQRRWWLAGLFLVGLLALNVFPPDTSNAPWKDPFLILLAIAIGVVCLRYGK